MVYVKIAMSVFCFEVLGDQIVITIRRHICSPGKFIIPTVHPLNNSDNLFCPNWGMWAVHVSFISGKILKEHIADFLKRVRRKIVRIDHSQNTAKSLKIKLQDKTSQVQCNASCTIVSFVNFYIYFCVFFYFATGGLLYHIGGL